MSSETVEKGQQYLSRADEILKAAGNELTVSGFAKINSSNSVDVVRDGLNELGPELTPLLQLIYDEKAHSNFDADPISMTFSTDIIESGSNERKSYSFNSEDEMADIPMPNHIDMALWQFLFQQKDKLESVEVDKK